MVIRSEVKDLNPHLHMMIKFTIYIDSSKPSDSVVLAPIPLQEHDTKMGGVVSGDLYNNFLHSFINKIYLFNRTYIP